MQCMGSYRSRPLLLLFEFIYLPILHATPEGFDQISGGFWGCCMAASSVKILFRNQTTSCSFINSTLIRCACMHVQPCILFLTESLWKAQAKL